VKDISYHILDIVQNSLHAGATDISVNLTENTADCKLILEISDNGCGMTAEELKKVIDPFFTTSVTKKVGLGLPLLKQNVELTRGTFSMESVEHKGTLITAVFHNNHIDMIPMGDLAITFKTLIAANPDINFIYRHTRNNRNFVLNTEEVRSELEDVKLNTPEVLNYLADFIRDNLKALTMENEK
jgi:Histidine kinase-, DNA gyrase B-, and HSP90-like ATPase